MPTDPEFSARATIVAEFYGALNRDDLTAALAHFDPSIERREPAGFPGAGTYRGLEEVRAHLAKGRGTWAEGGCEPTEIVPAGDQLVALVHVRVRLKDRQTWSDGRLADVFTFRGLEVIGFRTFDQPSEGLAWARGEPSPDAHLSEGISR